MVKKLSFSDIKEGSELPTLIKHPSTRQLVMWAGVSGDFYEIHYDKDFAVKQGQPGVIVHGDLTGAFLVQLLTDWIGEWGTFRKLRTSNRSPLFPNEDIICKGKITKKYIEGTENLVECEVWAENSKREKCVTGVGLVVFPN